MPARRSDAAFSPVVAGAILLMITMLLMLVAYVWAGSMGPHGDRPSLGLIVTSGAVESDTSGQWKTMTVQSASAGVHWWDVHVTLDGEPIRCAMTPGLVDSWRLIRGGSAQSCVGPRQSPDLLILAGDQLEIWDHHAGRFGEPPLAGRTLRIIDAETNVVVIYTILR